MRTEREANDALALAAQRIDWEGAHMGTWSKPVPQRRRNDPLQRTHRRVDSVLLLMLVCTVASLALQVI